MSYPGWFDMDLPLFGNELDSILSSHSFTRKTDIFTLSLNLYLEINTHTEKSKIFLVFFLSQDDLFVVYKPSKPFVLWNKASLKV